MRDPARLNAENQLLRERAAALAQGNQQLAAKLGEFEALGQRQQSIIEYIRSDQPARAAQLRAELAARESLSAELRAEKVALQEQLRDLRSELEQIAASLDERERANAELEAQLDALKQSAAVNCSLADRAASLHAENQQLVCSLLGAEPRKG